MLEKYLNRLTDSVKKIEKYLEEFSSTIEQNKFSKNGASIFVLDIEKEKEEIKKAIKRIKSRKGK